ncbi:hypothetical protein B484DRAFT_140666 [Ochromonadaceae sp. CCMP2298]|nr:hypothetical protein B484DRAFT_140666 [Ochromonadaceae sp. CCMP2298]
MLLVPFPILSTLSTLPTLSPHQVSRYGEFITASAPVDLWERLLKTQFWEFLPVESPAASPASPAFPTTPNPTPLPLVRCLHYSLPSSLAQHVSWVFNTVQLPHHFNPHAHVTDLGAAKGAGTAASDTGDAGVGAAGIASAGAADTGSRGNNGFTVASSGFIEGFVEPNRLRDLYTIPPPSDPTSSTHTSPNSHPSDPPPTQAVFATLEQSFSPVDLSTFQTFFGLPMSPVTDVIGGHMDDEACRSLGHCIEANLDVQYITSFGDSPTTFYYWGGDDVWRGWIMEVGEMQRPPAVFR